MTIEAAILQKVRSLPASQQADVLRFAGGLGQAKPKSAADAIDHSMDWLRQNRAGYLGQWVALENGQLIAAAADGLEVYRTAREHGIESPFVLHVTEPDSEPFVAGW